MLVFRVVDVDVGVTTVDADTDDVGMDGYLSNSVSSVFQRMFHDGLSIV